MSSKKIHVDNHADNDEAQIESKDSAVGQTVTDLLKNLDVGPWLDRASHMLQARPAVTIGAAMGAGFVLGLTLFSKIGRVALIAALGLGTEVVMQKMRRTASA